MRTKTVTRNIPESRVNANDRFRVRYKDRSAFDSLEVTINRPHTDESQVFTFSSGELPGKDSIHFTTGLSGGRMVVTWKGLDAAPRRGTVTRRATGDRSSVAAGGISESMPPVLGPSPGVLVLGTMPGRESLKRQEYYANPRNVFWQIMYELGQKDIEPEYAERIQFVKSQGIALWDVCSQAQRQGSLDSEIVDEIPNDLDALLQAHPSIKTVIFNGQRAEQLYDKHLTRRSGVRYTTCLSTSPANASYTLQQKLSDWKRALAANT
jgi:hypoxanthine-DNA glycosylase